LGEIASALGKRMTDTNVNVVSSAAGVIAALAAQIEGKGFGKHKASVVPPILDRLKEKKTADALGKALDAVFLTVRTFQGFIFRNESLTWCRYSRSILPISEMTALVRCRIRIPWSDKALCLSWLDRYRPVDKHQRKPTSMFWPPQW
jgi:hypothetical protein